MSDKKSVSTPFQCCRILFTFLLFMIIISNVAITVTALREEEGTPGREWGLGPLVKRGERQSVVSTENGEVSSVRVADGITGSYHLQFITLEPNSLFLPVVLHADMVFYVHTGSGRLTWMDETEYKSVDLRIGDVFRLPYGTIFFIESNLEPARQKLRVYSIFANSGDDLREPLSGPYSSIRDMVLGFDRNVLQAAFHVPEDVIDEVLNGTEVPAIIHGVPKTTKKTLWEMEAQFMKSLLGRGGHSFFDSQRNKKKTELFNIFKEKPDFENCNGWSTVITRKKLPALKGSHIGIYVVNLTKGSMMGPHWNPTATEIGIALQGEGIVRVVCSSTGTQQGCKNMRFNVEEGDVFAVPRFHPMAQMAFNNNSFVFVGFSTTTKRHHPQYLTGKASVLRTLDTQILAASFNVTNRTMDRILEAQGEAVILECTSCAEEEMRLMEEERRRAEEEARRREEEEARQREEERRREEEEARRKEEEEARKAEEERRKREAEEARRREEEAAKEKEEQRRRQEEEARRKEEEEARRQEEEIRRRQEEEEARKREEAEAAKRQQEEAAKREAEEARRREEEEAARKQHEEEEQRRRQEEETRRKEEEEARRQEEEIARRQEEEEARKREEAEAAKRRQEEAAKREAEEARRREEEEAARRQQEEEAQREAEEERRSEEKAERRREEQAQREAAEARRSEEEAERRREEQAQREAKEARRREEEAAARRMHEQEEAERERQAEEARREEKETRRHEEKEEEARKAERREEEEEEEERGGREEEEAGEAERRRQEEAERQEEAARRQEEEMERRHQEEKETEEEEQGPYARRRKRTFLKTA